MVNAYLRIAGVMIFSGNYINTYQFLHMPSITLQGFYQMLCFFNALLMKQDSLLTSSFWDQGAEEVICWQELGLNSTFQTRGGVLDSTSLRCASYNDSFRTFETRCSMYFIISFSHTFILKVSIQKCY